MANVSCYSAVTGVANDCPVFSLFLSFPVNPLNTATLTDSGSQPDFIGGERIAHILCLLCAILFLPNILSITMKTVYFSFGMNLNLCQVIT